MIHVCPLFSGSSGNSTYIGTREAGVLIDAGRSCKSIFSALDQCGIDPSAVKGILITHDHNDHISGLRVLAKRLRAPVYASEETLCGIVRAGCVEKETQLVELCSPSDIAGMGVIPFDTPHDVAHSQGFRLEAGERTVGFATDLGQVTPEIWEGLYGADLVFLEANYDEAMLAVSSYPPYLKARIRSNRGHLSNTDSAQCIRRLALSGTGRFILGHLSRENNTPDLAGQTVRQVLAESGLEEGQDFLLQVASRLEPSVPVRF